MRATGTVKWFNDSKEPVASFGGADWRHAVERFVGPNAGRATFQTRHDTASEEMMHIIALRETDRIEP